MQCLFSVSFFWILSKTQWDTETTLFMILKHCFWPVQIKFFMLFVCFLGVYCVWELKVRAIPLWTFCLVHCFSDARPRRTAARKARISCRKMLADLRPLKRRRLGSLSATNSNYPQSPRGPLRSYSQITSELEELTLEEGYHLHIVTRSRIL